MGLGVGGGGWGWGLEVLVGRVWGSNGSGAFLEICWAGLGYDLSKFGYDLEIFWICFGYGLGMFGP